MIKTSPSSSPWQAGLPSHATLLVASKNRVKIEAATIATRRCFPTISFSVLEADVPSGVPSQPIGEEETLRGAMQRVKNLKAEINRESSSVSRALMSTMGGRRRSLLIGIEGGVGPRNHDGKLECFAWVAIAKGWDDGSQEEEGGECVISTARSASFLLPPPLERLVMEEKMDLGEADDRLWKRKGSGKGAGTVGMLSRGVISRTVYCEQGVVMALLPFMSPDLYGDQYIWIK